MNRLLRRTIFSEEVLVVRETTDEHRFLLATLPPSQGQRRFALAVFAALFAAFVITVPFAFTPLPRVDLFIPTVTTAYLINDSITSALLFSQFSIVQRRALLVLAMGYLFSALMVIPYLLTFPGSFAPTGLLGAGLQSTVWIFIIWRARRRWPHCYLVRSWLLQHIARIKPPPRSHGRPQTSFSRNGTLHDEPRGCNYPG
jgi:hypothetical protein